MTTQDAQESKLHNEKLKETEKENEETSAEKEDPAQNLEKEIELLNQQLAEKQEQLLRAYADMENLRRRLRKEKEEAIKYANLSIMEALLPILDNLERALAAADKSDHAQSLREGVKMIYRQFQSVLEQAGLSKIESIGKPFDPHVHNAVMQVESDKHEAGIVVEEIQAGYRFIDRVIRPSMVKVSK